MLDAHKVNCSDGVLGNMHVPAFTRLPLLPIECTSEHTTLGKMTCIEVRRGASGVRRGCVGRSELVPAEISEGRGVIGQKTYCDARDDRPSSHFDTMPAASGAVEYCNAAHSPAAAHCLPYNPILTYICNIQA